MSELGQQLIAVVRRKVAEKPDYIYEQPVPERDTCLYVHDGKPSCLIGQALWEVGLIGADLETVDKRHNSDSITVLAQFLGIKGYLDEDELLWLRRVQQQQDDRKPWGRAVAVADDLAGLAEDLACL